MLNIRSSRLETMKNLLLLALILATPAASAGVREGLDAADRGDYVTAFAEYLSAAEGGDAIAQALVGAGYAEGRGVVQNFERAAYWYELAAKQGHRVAQYNLALLYQSGKGVKADPAKAIQWTVAAAMRGLPEAQTSLGTMLYYGTGVPRNYEAALGWFSRAAHQGHAPAQFNLGLMYAQGRGVTQSNALAYFWWLLAAAGNDRDAKQSIEKLEPRLSQSEVARIQREAADWRAKREPEH